MIKFEFVISDVEASELFDAINAQINALMEDRLVMIRDDHDAPALARITKKINSLLDVKLKMSMYREADK